MSILIDKDTTWAPEAGPYLVTQGVEVEPEATLTVLPGVQVRFERAATFVVQGQLKAIGTAAAPIVFTAVTTEPGWWSGITLRRASAADAPAQATLEHVVVEYGGRAGANLSAHGAQFSLTHGTLRHSSTDGLRTGNDIVTRITDSRFVANGGSALRFDDASVNPVLERLSTADNGADVIQLGSGYLTGDHAWGAGLPGYLVTQGVEVEPEATLTVLPGVQVRFERAATFVVQGQLKAIGTAAAPIVFTAVTTEPGWWSGITLRRASAADAPAQATLEHVVVEYGGRAGANLSAHGAQFSLTHGTLRHSSTDGLRTGNDIVTRITDSRFVANGGSALRFDDASVNPVLERLSAADNGADVIQLGSGYLTGDHAWGAGLPGYLVTQGVEVEPEATLTVLPGVQVRFERAATFVVQGQLKAIGTAAAPIVFTAVTTEPGWWSGITLRRASAADAPAQATLEHVVVEYGGRAGANLSAHGAQFSLTHGTLRHSSTDGLRTGNDGLTSTVQLSRIVDNAGYGIRSDDPTAIALAANNWWGAASGPATECNPGGTGSRITAGVAFRPFLTTPNAAPGLLAPADARILTIRPRRWFAPADDLSRLWFDITLSDGSGAPLAGRRVRVQSTLGRVTSGGLTDIEGRTLAYLVSATPGEATVLAMLDTGQCEFARSATTEVQFTESDPGDGLLPDGQAPYLNERIEIIPEPVTRGVPTILRATVINPTPHPLEVDGVFSYAQAGIGLTFGPIGEVLGQLIPANGQGVLEIEWMPTVSAKYCIQFEYTSRRPEAGQQ